MAKVSVICGYYDDYDMLMKNYETTRPHLGGDVDFIVVDDGSPKRPLTADTVPGWKVYQITEDIGFNNEGARNLGMHVTETEWNLMTDLDHFIKPHSIPKLAPLVETLDPKVAYYPRREHDRQTINAQLLTKHVFWTCNGYDETYTGYYGYDNTLQCYIREHFSQIILDDEIYLDWVRGARPSTASRAEKTRQQDLYKEMRRKVEAGELPHSKERLRFPWKRIA